MGYTIAEKILARTAGRNAANAGDILWAVPDVMITHDYSYPGYRDAMRKMGIENIASPEKLILTVDHRPYSDNIRIVEARKQMRDDVKRQGIKHFFDVGRNGISHNLPLDYGLVMPGMLVVSSDTRAPSLGCTGALSVAIGGGLVTVMVCGKVWLRVPQTLSVKVVGRPQSGVMSRDIGVWIAKTISMDKADYRVVEISGSALQHFDLESRHTICNAMVDIGVKSAVVAPDDCLMDYVSRFAGDAGAILKSDDDAEFAERFCFDISDLSPQISLPPEPENLHPVAAAAGEKIDQAFIGSCMGGKLEDLRAAAAMLRGRKVHAHVRLIVIPATQAIFAQATREGLMDIFAAASAQIAVGACGPCFGTLAPLSDNEVCISTSTRNDVGRMGSPTSRLILASAATVAASAVNGCVTDPREFL
jgi:3-isopropylmalate/(R)-2-methylmalate dehydratase large subunit